MSGRSDRQNKTVEQLSNDGRRRTVYTAINFNGMVTFFWRVLYIALFSLLLRRCLTKNSTAVIQLEVSRPVCMELYQDCRELGRFMLRSGGATIAAGVVTKVHVQDMYTCIQCTCMAV